MAYDLQNRKIKAIEASAAFPGYAKMIGNTIFSINFKNNHNWVDQEFGYSSLEGHSFTKIENEYINIFDAFADQVAYINSKQELILYNLNSKEKVNLSERFRHTFDTIDYSSDGTLIAGYTDSEHKKSKLFLIGPVGKQW